jgi:hypothetical protein
MLFHNRIAACLTLLLVLVACGRNPSEYQITLPTPAPTLTPPPRTALPFTAELQTNWLAGKPCAPPCWEGVIPGQTSLDEAINILNQHPQMGNIAIYDVPKYRGGVVGWEWSGHPPSGYGLLHYQRLEDSTAALINSISVQFPDHFSLAPIIAAYGEPSYIAPHASLRPPFGHPDGKTIYYEITVVYQNRGFYLMTFPASTTPPHIAQDMTVSSSVVFFPPTGEGLEAAEGGERISASLVPWQGEQDFVTYCRQVQSGADSEQLCPSLGP